MSAELRWSENDIKLAIKQRVCAGHNWMDPNDIVVHLEISERDVSARITWEDNVKRDEQTWESEGQFYEVPYGC